MVGQIRQRWFCSNICTCPKVRLRSIQMSDLNPTEVEFTKLSWLHSFKIPIVIPVFHLVSGTIRESELAPERCHHVNADVTLTRMF